jgi:hypothetical protein
MAIQPAPPGFADHVIMLQLTAMGLKDRTRFQTDNMAFMAFAQ